MEQLTSERLQDNLSRLKLTRAAEVLDTVVEQAKDTKSSYFAFLDHLLEEEVAAKEKRRIFTSMRTAGLPLQGWYTFKLPLLTRRINRFTLRIEGVQNFVSVK